MSAPISLAPFRWASSLAARFGAFAKPLADGAPSGPGSDQSHDRQGVIFRKGTKSRGRITSRAIGRGLAGHTRRQS
jgi:hypothetical protein